MTKTWVALGAGALAVVLVASTFDTAEARRGGGWGGFRAGGGGHFAARPFAPRFAVGPRYGRVAHFAPRRHFRRGVFIGAPLAYGAYAYGYGYGGCRWLRHRALETGSRYWWSRYYDCVNGYY
jgi:hypothetical protein